MIKRFEYSVMVARPLVQCVTMLKTPSKQVPEYAFTSDPAKAYTSHWYGVASRSAIGFHLMSNVRRLKLNPQRFVVSSDLKICLIDPKIRSTLFRQL